MYDVWFLQEDTNFAAWLQKGDNAAVMEAKKKELELKRAAAASKGAKVFYKVNVKVSCNT